METPVQMPNLNLEKLLVCTDGSPDSAGVVAAALDLAGAAGSKIYLLQVITFVSGYEFQMVDVLPPTSPVNIEMVTMREAAVKESLETYKTEAANRGIDLEVRVLTSPSAYTGILEEAEAVQPHLIIMGRHGYTGLTRLLMGSVTARVIGHSPFDVLVVPPGVSLNFQKLLIASDGSPYSEAALADALAIAKARGSVILGASVAQGEAEIPRAREIVEKMEAAALQQGVPLEPYLLQGRPYEAIIKLAHQKQADLIILGSHGHTGLKRLLMGSVAERVIGQAPCATLVVKKGG
jgi:nucleotide-binding universal stress UspA family protein